MAGLPHRPFPTAPARSVPFPPHRLPLACPCLPHTILPCTALLHGCTLPHTGTLPTTPACCGSHWVPGFACCRTHRTSRYPTTHPLCKTSRTPTSWDILPCPPACSPARAPAAAAPPYATAHAHRSYGNMARVLACRDNACASAARQHSAASAFPPRSHACFFRHAQRAPPRYLPPTFPTFLPYYHLPFSHSTTPPGC